MTSTLRDTAVLPSCPYPGLRPFRADEAVVFFGRDTQVDELLDRLGRKRFVAVVGTSGCGKSSLVHAGLIPALGTGFLGAAGARWAVATMRPGDRPLWRLAQALLDPEVLGPAWSDLEHPAGQLHAMLRRGPLGLVEVLDESPLAGGRKLLLIVDQFEELFRYLPGGEGQRDEANAFVSLLQASINAADAITYVVMTMRSDYLGDCALFDGLPEALNDGQFLTPKLTRQQRQQAIEGPARVLEGRTEPALVSRILNDMGSGPDQLPLMQHALMRLWKGSQGTGVLTVAAYEALGGLEGALSGQANAAYESLDGEGQRITEMLFRQLSSRTVSGRDTRLPTSLEEIANVAEVTPQAVIAVVEIFRHPDRTFLTPAWPQEIGSGEILDISHESLIRHWDRLRSWVADEAASADVYRRLDQTARLWSEGRAGLWGSPDLDQALRWKEISRPNAAWAARYGGDFELAMRFLNASMAERARKQTEEQKRLADEAYKNRRLAEFERQRAEEAEARGRQAEATARRQEELTEQVSIKNRVILDIARNLSSASRIDFVAPKILDSLMELFPQAERLFLVLVDPETKRLVRRAFKYRPTSRRGTPFSGAVPDDEVQMSISRTIVNHVLGQKKAVLSQDAGNDRSLPTSELIADLRIRSVMCVPLLTPDRQAIGILQLDTSDRSQFHEDDLNVLVAVASQAAIAVQNAQMHEALLEQERINRDLKLAEQVQRRFLPQSVPVVPGHEFSAYYHPAYEVGGDYYDFVPLPGGRLAIAVGDVSGRGVAAALMMAKFSGDTRYCILTKNEPAVAANELNNLLIAAGIEEKFVTLSLSVLDVATGRLTVCSAGALPLLVRRASGKVEEVGEDITGFPLGIIPDSNYQQTVVQLEPGDVVVVYSDGVTDARNVREELYDSRDNRRLLWRIAETSGGPVAVGKAIIQDIREFSAGHHQADDITLVGFGSLARSS